MYLYAGKDRIDNPSREKLSDEFERWIEDFKRKMAIEALYEVARTLRSEEYGPYETESGYGSDDWGNESKRIDSWYAKYIEEQADRMSND